MQIVGRATAESDSVLTPDALEFVAALQREFGERRTQLLAARAERQRRLDAGRRCYAAWTEGSLAAYGWVSFGEEEVSELGLRLRLLPDEAYIWDCVTLPAYQRRGLYAALLGYILQTLRSEGVGGIWIGADFDNGPSQAGIGRAGFTAVADLVAAPPRPGERRRRAWLVARPGISAERLAEGRRAYLGDREEVWLFE